MIKFSGYKDSRAQEFAVLALVFVLPFFHRFANVALELVFLTGIIEIFRRKHIPPLKMHWFLPALFLYFSISELVWAGEIGALEKRVFFILVPLAFAIIPVFYDMEIKQKIFKSFILGNVIALVVCFVRAILRSLTLEDGRLLFNTKVIRDSDYDFFTSAVMGGNYFFSTEFALFHHPTFFSLYIVFAQYLIIEQYGSSPKRIKGFLAAAFVLLVLGLFLLSSKAAIMSMFLVWFWLVFRFKVSTAIRSAFVVVIASICVLFFFFNPRMKVFKDSFQTKQVINPEAQYGHDLRILSWDASLTIIKSSWLFGVGEPNKEAALMDVYKNKGYKMPAEDKHNSHNQYLDFLIGGGVVGLGLLATGLGGLTAKSIKDHNFPLQAFLIIFCFNALFENLLSRHDGILLFSLFICLLNTNQRSTTAVNNT